MGQIRALSGLKPRDRGKITQVTGQARLKRKLLDMGMVPGSELEVLRIAPFGDPVEVKIKGYNLSLRKEEAEQVLVEAAGE